MGMSHSTSGRTGYNAYQCCKFHTFLSEPEVTVLKLMLRKENELRICEETQQKYKFAQTDGFEGFVRVTEELQKQVSMTIYN